MAAAARKKKSRPALDSIELLRQLSPVKRWLSTGCTILDLALANQLPGGFPGGRISHVYGMESTGKTVLACEPLGSAQRQNGIAMLADVEGTFDWDRAELFGLDVGEKALFSYMCPRTVEELFDKEIAGAVDFLRGENMGGPSAMAVDSLSALTALPEDEKDLDNQGYGAARAKVIGTAFRKYIWDINEVGLAVIFIDQSRINLAKQFGDKETTSGGKALDFFASTCVQLKYTGQITNEYDKPVGVQLKFIVRKNKVAPPFREGVFDLLFDIGIDDVSTNLAWLRDNYKPLSALTGRGKPYITFGPDAAGFGEEGKSFRSAAECVAYVEENDLEGELRQKVAEVWAEVYQPMVRKPKARHD